LPCLSVFKTIFCPRFLKVNETSTEAWLALGSFTVEYKQLTMCTVLISFGEEGQTHRCQPQSKNIGDNAEKIVDNLKPKNTLKLIDDCHFKVQ
jgi:hypothetical protein